MTQLKLRDVAREELCILAWMGAIFLDVRLRIMDTAVHQNQINQGFITFNWLRHPNGRAEAPFQFIARLLAKSLKKGLLATRPEKNMVLLCVSPCNSTLERRGRQWLALLAEDV